VKLDDLPVFERLWGDERVGRTLGGPRSGAEVQAALESAVEHWSRHGYGRWLLHEDGQPVGTVKLATCEVAGKSEVELGYALLPERWGAGYATEAAAGGTRLRARRRPASGSRGLRAGIEHRFVRRDATPRVSLRARL